MNFRKEQKIVCVKLPNTKGHPLKLGKAYTVDMRCIVNDDPCITLKEFDLKLFPSSCFLSCEDYKNRNSKCICPPMHGGIGAPSCSEVDGFTIKVYAPKYDIELKRKWEQSVIDERYEDSRIYYDELIERKVKL
tara:strand:+ start:675 stop:1076 length:402 start_codon:yes stop_codon:yes gene_type:complete